MPIKNPQLITEIHVRRAAESWDKEKFPNFGNSLKYNVIINEKPYPPKAICSKAYELATGSTLLSNEFVGAINGLWLSRLKELKFEIQSKRFINPITTISTPKTIKVWIVRYVRDPKVVKQRLAIANGICEGGKHPAPFLRRADDTPYLEVHHVKPLSAGGFDVLENTQALCPNCHCMAHDRLGIDRYVE
ncbi:HNH endonuclease [Polaromonas sp. DSR2-3-2]|uniref:HNH endonuclease n=1 Tax=unclassified Polaromonas TaxID=2638319 RepID=UPI003CE9780C